MAKEAEPVGVREVFTPDDFKVELGPVRNFLSTGCTLLDLAIANRLPGGFPAGRISQIYGDESTAKSVLAAEVIGSAQRQGGLGSMNDTEGTFDEQRAAELHDVKQYSPSLWQLTQNTKSIEELFDDYFKKLIDKVKDLEKPSCSVVDTLSALPSKKELEGDLDAASYGTSRALKLSSGFRKYINDFNSVNLGVIFIDQVRDNVGVTFGDTKTTSGGRAVKFYSSVRVALSHEERLKNSKEKVVGVKLGFFVKKNKIAPPFREGSFRVLFDYGIDDVASSIEWLHANDPASKKEKWEIPVLKLVSNGLNGMCKKVEEQNLEKELVQEVQRVWDIVYAPIERKKRVRIGN
jgi:recombination protein RecA